MQEQAGREGDREDRAEGQDHVDRIVQQLGMGIGTVAKREPISVVVVARNNLALTKLAIRSVERQDCPTEILVVDNASSDGTKQWLRTKSLTTISAPEQWSLAKCWNAALASLWRAGWTKALVCNNDIELRPDTVKLLNAHGGEFVTCVSVNSPEQVDVAIPREGDPWTWNEREHPDFSCFMLGKTVTDRVGWFNESYFPAYAEDAEFHVRLHRAGIRAVCVDIPFLHHGAGTLKHASAGEVARIRRGADANRERFRLAYGCLPGSDEYQELFR